MDFCLYSLMNWQKGLSNMGFFKILGKVAASVVTGTAGIAAEVVENFGAASGCEPLANLGHSAKTAGFNATRKIWGKEEKEYDYADGHSFRNAMDRASQKRDQITSRQHIAKTGVTTKNRRTDSELENDSTGLDLKARDYQFQKNVSLSQAVDLAESTPGVYVLYLNGRVMKCGRAAYGQGIHWRFQQYYSLNYDDKARQHDYWSISPANRDSVMVSWQCCPVSKCKELEYKLFQKYGKGPWGLRAPQNCSEDSWELLI